MSAARTMMLRRKKRRVNDEEERKDRKRTHPFSPLRTDLTTSLTPRLRCRDLEAECGGNRKVGKRGRRKRGRGCDGTRLGQRWLFMAMLQGLRTPSRQSSLPERSAEGVHLEARGGEGERTLLDELQDALVGLVERQRLADLSEGRKVHFNLSTIVSLLVLLALLLRGRISHRDVLSGGGGLVDVALAGLAHLECLGESREVVERLSGEETRTSKSSSLSLLTAKSSLSHLDSTVGVLIAHLRVY
jgi:hypothetical protein